jgi:hypothetical protein
MLSRVLGSRQLEWPNELSMAFGFPGGFGCCDRCREVFLSSINGTQWVVSEQALSFKGAALSRLGTGQSGFWLQHHLAQRMALTFCSNSSISERYTEQVFPFIRRTGTRKRF